MERFTTRISIIGVNPFVRVPRAVLDRIFTEAGEDRGPIPIRGTIDGHPFLQTLVKYSGAWRMYLNTPMRKAARKDVGDKVTIEMEHDPRGRPTPMHPKFQEALAAHARARSVFESLSPSRQKEILRYLNNLKQEAAIDRNIARAIRFLEGDDRFVGRSTP